MQSKNRQSPETPGIKPRKKSAPHGRPSGDPSAVEPPVPIPNTEVKRCSPDDSAPIGCAKVGRRQSPRPASDMLQGGAALL